MIKSNQSNSCTGRTDAGGPDEAPGKIRKGEPEQMWDNGSGHKGEGGFIRTLVLIMVNRVEARGVVFRVGGHLAR